MKIYIVTSGSYSNYEICSVHLSMEDAHRGAEIAKMREPWDSDTVRVEVYDVGVNSRNLEDELLKSGLKLWKCYCDDDEINIYPLETDASGFLFCIKKDCFGTYYLTVKARDEEHAKKIFADKLAEFKYKEMEEEK